MTPEEKLYAVEKLTAQASFDGGWIDMDPDNVKPTDTPREGKDSTQDGD